MLLLLFFTNRETRSGFVFHIPVFFIITRPFNKHTYMYVHTANVIKGAGATIGAGKKNSISPKGEFETIPGGSNNKVKSRLPALQFVPVQRMKPWETSHPSVVVTTTKLKVNIQ